MYDFKTTNELLALCKNHKIPISEVTIRYEMARSKESRAEIWAKMEKIHQVMREAIENGIHRPEKSAFGMSGGNASKIFKALSKGPFSISKNPPQTNSKTRSRPMEKNSLSKKSVRQNAQKSEGMLLNPLAVRSMTYATATGECNSAMGRIAAFPTAGGSGVVPGCVLAMEEECQLDKETAIRGLFTASGIGIIIAEGATFSAAAGGCQAEVGAATAMAAAAVTEMRGGSPDQAANAAALALKNKLGLACDPLGGLVAVPCIKRNALGTVHSFGASDLSMAGVISFIPFDDVVFAMLNISHIMSPKLRETALGGLAVTPTGLKIRKKLGLRRLKKEEID